MRCGPIPVRATAAVNMKVLDLQCRQGHRFEGWFGSQEDYDTQRVRGLLTCPVCQDSDITKMLSAPRLNLGHAQAPHPPQDGESDLNRTTATADTPTLAMPSGAPLEAVETLAQVQAAVLQMVRRVVANSEDVGPRFAEEARKIHYGEREVRSIRGQASPDETEALLEEGIEVVSLPPVFSGPLQ